MSDVENFSEAGERIRELRAKLSQAEFADRIAVHRKTVERWEAGERLPDGQSLLALMTVFGADVNYLLSGVRSGSAQAALTAEEQTMLGYFREASKEVRRAALGALLGAPAGTGYGSGAGSHFSTGTHSQHSTGDGAVQIGSIESKPTTRRRK